MSALPITGQLLGAFKPSKRFSSKHGTRITSIDFDDTGEWCVTAGDDETIQLYDCKRGKYFPPAQVMLMQTLKNAVFEEIWCPSRSIHSSLTKYHIRFYKGGWYCY